MRLKARTGAASAITLAIAAALLAAPLDSEAKGGRRSGSGGGAAKDTAAATAAAAAAAAASAAPAAAAPAAAAAADKERAGTSGTHLAIRRAPSANANAKKEEPAAPPGRVRVVLPGPSGASDAAPAPEAQARPAADRTEAAPPAPATADQRAEPERQGPTAAEHGPERARPAAAAQARKTGQPPLHAELEAVLERARNDYPVLRTEEGEPILRSILARQKVLQKQGLYPSVAMVEAVADHSDTLRPRVRTAPPPAPAQVAPDYSRSFGTCRWVDAFDTYLWTCK